MATRILRRYMPEFTRDHTEQGGADYLDKDYEPVAVRIYARIPPTTGDLQIDFKVDGVSIMENYALLGEGETSTAMAEDFKEDSLMAEGSWVTMDVIRDGGAKDITAQIELYSEDEDEEGD